uniref:Putative HNH endonuclease n=1 Tax=viral metagenome TaxID=1070528 RepID=A0A6M3XTI9_9ZZZZ
MAQVSFSRQVLARDIYICRHCGQKARIAHDPTSQHRDISVGIALCDSCHKQLHSQGIAGRRINIYFTNNTYQKLRDYIRQKHGKHRVLSAIVQEATKEYLERNNI